MAGRRVTVVEHNTSLAMVSRAMARAMIDYVKRRYYTSHDGAVAIRGQTHDDDQTFDHAGETIRMVACRSSLAVWQALLQRREDEWLVIVTDRELDDLGDGILAHLIGHTLRRPDPWQAVCQRFSAYVVDARLTAEAGHHELAFGLLEVLPADGVPPAPAGVLGRDHALGTVVRKRLEFAADPSDLSAVLGWSVRATAADELAALRTIGGDVLTDAVIAWLGSVAGAAEPLVVAVLRSGRPGDLVPLGLAVAQLTAVTSAERQQPVDLALARLSHRWKGVRDQAVHALAPAAEDAVRSRLNQPHHRDDAQRLIIATDALISEAQADDLAAFSDVLTAGLNHRFALLADALAKQSASTQTTIEDAWGSLSHHALARGDSRTRACEAAVRLSRWLATDAGNTVPRDLGGQAVRQLATDGWVDAAVNDASAGVGDDNLGHALGSVLTAVTAVRDEHDREFAREVAQTAAASMDTLDQDGTKLYPLERLLPEVVLGLSGTNPVLLLVLDGMSTGVSVDLMDDLVNAPGTQWAEALLPQCSRRAGGIAVLPSITDVSRTSLLAGTLQRGQQAAETNAYQALTTAHGQPNAPIFHKKDLDTTRPGFSLADDVRAAIDNRDTALVTCVLNMIDDSLDRSDPAGTHWDVDSIKHLRPLLDRARTAGRTVIITSDHGHVVERRQGYPRTADGTPGATRYRSADGEVHNDEIAVQGERVLTPDNAAVLAASERLRYGPLKAGYHGGATPAEVVVPVIVTVPVEMVAKPPLELATPQEPHWWTEPPVTVEPASSDRVISDTPTLLDSLEDETPTSIPLGTAIVESATFAEQRELAGRITVQDASVAALIDRLAAAPQGRLSPVEAARTLDVGQARVAGAFEQVRKLLNVEGYPVVRRDLSTGVIIWDESLAREQFGIGS